TVKSRVHQATDRYKARRRPFLGVSGLSNSLLLGTIGLVCAVAVGCGSGSVPAGSAPVLLHADDLPGWRAMEDAPGIADLAPDLSGLTVTGRADSPALVRAGDAVRATAVVFETVADAAEALERAKAAD